MLCAELKRRSVSTLIPAEITETAQEKHLLHNALYTQERYKGDRIVGLAACYEVRKNKGR